LIFSVPPHIFYLYWYRLQPKKIIFEGFHSTLIGFHTPFSIFVLLSFILIALGRYTDELEGHRQTFLFSLLSLRDRQFSAFISDLFLHDRGFTFIFSSMAFIFSHASHRVSHTPFHGMIFARI